jgi:hypothetical protein
MVTQLHLALVMAIDARLLVLERITRLGLSVQDLAATAEADATTGDSGEGEQK